MSSDQEIQIVTQDPSISGNFIESLLGDPMSVDARTIVDHHV
jgi:hypothetical protein